MKERFSVSMDKELTEWLDKLVDEKIFSSRSHALEFCVKQISKIGIKNVVLMHWGEGEAEPVFMQDSDIKVIDSFAKAKNISRDEAAQLLVRKGIKDDS
ncbi:ribbon-helix-helix domain-containing protein [Methanosarcina sp. WWM596]|uniref:ribbon-helix-helix domain-containing protein n=1 Tax=Methanosarcina sp. WWM596 TaxID=1434103 RepID=UPI00064E34C1|nr:ribbon-helix-helix domain-containing protein [Methanosarcina sp. WWM596]